MQHQQCVEKKSKLATGIMSSCKFSSALKTPSPPIQPFRVEDHNSGAVNFVDCDRQNFSLFDEERRPANPTRPTKQRDSWDNSDQDKSHQVSSFFMLKPVVLLGPQLVNEHLSTGVLTEQSTMSYKNDSSSSNKMIPIKQLVSKSKRKTKKTPTFRATLSEYNTEEALITEMVKNPTQVYYKKPTKSIKTTKHHYPRKLLEMQDALIKVCQLESELDNILD